MENKRPLLSLTRRADFLRLKDQGRTFHVNSWLLVNFARTDDQKVRCGWTISRHIGIAVTRNRLRRWGKDYLRTWRKSVNVGLDVNFVFKRMDKARYKSMAHGEFAEAMEKSVIKLDRYLV